MKGFGPVAPPQILRALKDHGVLGTYHLLLAHDVLARGQEYYDLFGVKEWRTREGMLMTAPEMTVILDNSVVELGDACDADTIATAAASCRANVVVLPDVLMDGPATVERTKGAIDSWKKQLDNALGSASTYSFMVVPQGKTIEEWVTCAEQLADLPNVGWWGIPRNFRKITGRKLAVRLARTFNPKRKIHLLGFSDDIVDDILTARYERVEGIDSAVPLRAATLGKHISAFTNLPPRGDWWEQAEFTPLMLNNVQQVRRWLNDEEATDGQ